MLRNQQKAQYEEDIQGLESKIKQKEERGKNAEKYKIELVRQRKEQEIFLKKQLHDKNMQKVRQQREQEANKVLDKIAQVEERLGNIESSNYLIDKKAREEDKRRKLREAFEQKEQNQRRLEELQQEKN